MIFCRRHPVWHDPEAHVLYTLTSDAVAPAVVIPYVTMHESPGMAKYLAEKIAEKGWGGPL